MLKHLGKYLALIVTCVLVFGSIQVRADSDDSFEAYAFNALSERRGAEFATNYTRTLNMLNNFVESLPVTRTGDIMFPSYYGGAYITEDGNAVLLIVESQLAEAHRMESSISFMQRSEYLTVRYVEFSYSELVETTNLLIELIFDSPSTPATENVRGWYMDVRGNRVVVELVEYSEDAINHFRRMVVDLPQITFELAQEEIVLENSLNETTYDQHMLYIQESIDAVSNNALVAFVGDRIDIWRNGAYVSWGSIGYRAWAGDVPGFVTAAHLGGVLRNGDRIYTQNRGHFLGHVSIVQLQRLDAAFVSLAPGVDIVSGVGGMMIRGPAPHFFVGQEVAARGAGSNGIVRHGHVESVSDSFHMNLVCGTRVNITNSIRSTHSMIDGDSGGIVFCTSTRTVVGINIGFIRYSPIAFTTRHDYIRFLMLTPVRL